MSSETLLYIIFAGIIALLLALFQYFRKGKNMSKLNMFFSFLRFISVFCVLLLVINPSFEQIQLSVEKPNLVVAIDNSTSIEHLKQNTQTLNFIEGIRNNVALNEKFNVDFYTFGDQLKVLDSVSFSEKQTNIHNAFKQLSQVYKQSMSPTILISDGNQTYGNDYQFVNSFYKHPIYPVILGDTAQYTDLKIQQLNVNRYAYLKNEFPVETIVVYNGYENVNSKFVVSSNDRVVYSKDLKFSKEDNSKVVHFTMPASKVGVSKYKAEITPLSNEKNTINNTKNFAVEVVNQKTNIAIVSDFSHPDIGALKKSIESNEQRFVSILKPNEVVGQINDFQLFILYQPSNRFKLVFDKFKALNKNYFTIIGVKTNLNFVNNSFENYRHEISNQKEDYQAELNTKYNPFIIEDIGFESFPPLHSNYGSLHFDHPIDVILNKTVHGVLTNEPLLLTFENSGRREALLLGENIWQWRAHSYLQNQSFHEFDDFVGKLVQYLASNEQKSRLRVDFQSFYDGNNHVVIKAEYFDKNYVFDARERLNIIITEKDSKSQITRPLILKNHHFEVNLSGLEPAKYNFTVKSKNGNISKSGSFEILEYNVEQQFLNANVSKLEQLADNSLGTPYFIANSSGIFNEILGDERYVSIQKSSRNTIPLIDWKYLLAIIALSLGVEWFLRKYNGLI
ncbi:VWA domain-containing protein [Tamlana agarivorans]|uniref:VWA domain-containing protein n=1 Tax=Pseudotamlana agarivorans TaxID=481183 RepID=A0ACC5U9X7_9FLAO|nr:VWA domain-containing protein [Tamlana agarivorans]MBU2951132.1 VWA domain-containing protein [Tamlana agarivorans]